MCGGARSSRLPKALAYKARARIHAVSLPMCAECGSRRVDALRAWYMDVNHATASRASLTILHHARARLQQPSLRAALPHPAPNPHTSIASQMPVCSYKVSHACTM